MKVISFHVFFILLCTFISTINSLDGYSRVNELEEFQAHGLAETEIVAQEQRQSASSLTTTTTTTGTPPPPTPPPSTQQTVPVQQNSNVNRYSRTKTPEKFSSVARASLSSVASDYGQGLAFFSEVTEGSTEIIEYIQTYGNSSYPVFGCNLRMTRTGSMVRYIDTLVNISNAGSLEVQYSESDAITNTRDRYPPSYKANLVIVCELYMLPSFYWLRVPRSQHDGVAKLCYYCQASNNDNWMLLAQTLGAVFSWSNNQTATAATVYNGNVNINTLPSGGTYYLEDVNRTSTTVDCNNGDCSSSVNKLTDADNVWTAYNEQISTQVQWGVAQVLDYFKTVQGRNGLDGNGGGPNSVLSQDGVTNLQAHKIHYGTNVNYASWTGSDFIYGDGDGTNYGPMVSLDIVAHEMSHAIMEYECNLNYFGESGALRESFGDAVAAVVSYWTFGENAGTWTFGEDVYTPGISGDAMRYMNEPSLADNKGYTMNDDPDHYSEMYNGTLDNGGVHSNCGIPNKAFYLLAKGGNHSNGGVTMTGVGIDVAFAILYRAVTTYYTINTDFAGARTAMLYAASDLYGAGGVKYIQVQTAWGLCGVGSVPTPSANILSNPGFESDSNPWGITGTGAIYQRSGPEKKAGYGYMKMGVSNSLSGAVHQTFFIPTNTIKANFSFWIYTTTADSNSVIHDRLYIEIKNSTNNALISQLAIYSNVDATTGYIQKAYSLMPFLNILDLRVEFRVVNDGNAPTTFRIDEAYLHLVTY